MESRPDYFKQYGMFHSSIVSIYYHTRKKHKPCKCRSRATQVSFASRASVEQEPYKCFSLHRLIAHPDISKSCPSKFSSTAITAGIVFSDSSYSQIKTIH